jgi:hypothetical protein
MKNEELKEVFPTEKQLENKRYFAEQNISYLAQSAIK